MRASLDSGAPTPHAPPSTSGCTCCTSLSSSGRRGRSGSGLGMLMRPLWPSAGAGVRVGIRRGWRPCRHPFQEQHPGLRRARAGFQSAGVQGGTEQVAWCAWSGAATSVFTARASPRRPAAARVAVGSPSSLRRLSLGERWLRWGGRGQTPPGWERALLMLDGNQVATECDP